MRKNKEQLELLVVMQKHKISELTLIKRRVYIRQNVDTILVDYFVKKIAKAKMKLNHYKQLLGNATAVVLPPVEPPLVRLQFGDRVMIKDGWQNSELYVPYLAKFIGLEGIVRTASGDGSYTVRTSLDEDVPDNRLFTFPPEALELITNNGEEHVYSRG